ncbi:hypothetical protein TSUD_416120 [Trifolium subterraneum]|uniref:Myb/SANT-like domain-containing protein n=1 Tax=Trifolium subterraneum TaxID=3900 RepID=A0A2Z6P7I7_TRISU|nr:hypothetical protein TSUD_416120 [Trifolium subterraneum]
MEDNSKRQRKSKGVDTCNWTIVMDEVLIDAYLYQQTLGNKNGNSMTTSAMDNILQELKTHFPDKPITKDKIKDHMKNIKTKFNVCYDVFKNGLSGFAWDRTKNMWVAEEEEKSEAAEWKNKPIMFYDKLATLFGKDRATGEHEDTPFEMRARKAANAKRPSPIEEIDHLVEANEVTLERFDVDEEFDPEGTPQMPSISKSQDVPSSRTKKRETSKKVELVKQSKSASGEDIWAQFVEIGVEEDSLPHVYMHLV